MLKNELETLGKAWSKLEEQNSRKVLNLIEKEDAISRLTGEVFLFFKALIICRKSD